jgi:hypothetical protein
MYITMRAVEVFRAAEGSEREEDSAKSVSKGAKCRSFACTTVTNLALPSFHGFVNDTLIPWFVDDTLIPWFC